MADAIRASIDVSSSHVTMCVVCVHYSGKPRESVRLSKKLSSKRECVQARTHFHDLWISHLRE